MWNAEGILRNGRELVLSHLLAANNVDIIIVTETEIPADSRDVFNMDGYTSFLPGVGPAQEGQVQGHGPGQESASNVS
jgi:hypothetical protein